MTPTCSTTTRPSQIALVNSATGEVTPIGKPAVYCEVSRRRPGGNYLLVERVHRPYSYLCTYYRFPERGRGLDDAARRSRQLASLPLAEQVPIDGVPTGPRDSMLAARPNRPRWSGPRRSTAAIPRPRSHTATG